jgi:hypothetical protein
MLDMLIVEIDFGFQRERRDDVYSANDEHRMILNFK